MYRFKVYTNLKYFIYLSGLMGSDVLEELRVDELIETITEIYTKYFIPVFYEKDETKQVKQAV